MKKAYEVGQHTRRIQPCSDYDMTGIEGWLSEMAEEGWLFDGYSDFLGLAEFTYHGPCRAKYYLEPVPGKKSFFGASPEIPDQETIEQYKEMSWEYVTKRGMFFIFRSLDVSPGEIKTEPEALAAALDPVRKHYRPSVITGLIAIVLFYFGMSGTYPIMTGAWNGKAWIFDFISILFIPLLYVHFIIVQARGFFHIRRIQRVLRGDSLSLPDPDWRSRLPVWLTERILFLILIVGVVVSLAGMLRHDEEDWTYTSLAEYEGELPFATIRDFVGEGGEEYQLMAPDPDGRKKSEIRETSGLLAPRYIDYDEFAQVRSADGKLISGWLDVSFYEMGGQLLAKGLVRELCRFGQSEQGYVELDTSGLDADYAIGWVDKFTGPRVIIRKGNVVIDAQYYSMDDSEMDISFEEWTSILCESMEGGK